MSCEKAKWEAQQPKFDTTKYEEALVILRQIAALQRELWTVLHKNKNEIREQIEDTYAPQMVEYACDILAEDRSLQYLEGRLLATIESANKCF